MGLFDRFIKSRFGSAEDKINSLSNEEFQKVLQNLNAGKIAYVKTSLNITDSYILEDAINKRITAQNLAIISQIDDQNILKYFTGKNHGSEVKLAAVSKITDESILLQIARTDLNFDVLEMAINKINDESLLFDIAIDTKYNIQEYNYNPFVRLKALEKITDDNLLYKIVLENNEPKIYLNAIHQIQDIDLLTDLLLNCKLDENKKETILYHKLFSDIELREILTKTDDEFIKVHAIKHIDDEEMLKEILKEDSSYKVKIEIISKIKDQETIKHYALHGTPIVRSEAVKYLQDNETLEHIVKTDNYSKVREMVIRCSKFDNQLLKDIALNDSEFVVCNEAIRNISDDNILAEIAMITDDGAKRGACLNKIRDEDVLAEINKKHPLTKCPKCGSFRVYYSHYYDESVDLFFWGNTCKNCHHHFNSEPA